MTKRKTLQELTLLDRFLFDETVENPDNMRAMLEIILGKDIPLKAMPQTEKEQRTSSMHRFIKMDVWAKDENDVVYDVESQKRDTENLPKRSRFYQALIDSKLLEPGVADFNQLNPLFVIIISPFDLFGKKRYRYTFTMQCREVPRIELNDGAVRMFLNTQGTDDENITPELKELLYLFEHTNDRDRKFQSEKVRKIRDSVRNIQNNAETGVKYMQAWEEIAIAKQEGKEEVLIGLIRKKLAKGQSLDQISEALEESPEYIQKLIDRERS